MEQHKLIVRKTRMNILPFGVRPQQVAGTVYALLFSFSCDFFGAIEI
jgi:hypothetical protein